MQYPFEEYKNYTYNFSCVSHIINDMDIYEFGVCGGQSLSLLLNSIILKGKTFNKVFGFDSFQGLPEEQNGIEIHPQWCFGSFDARITTKSSSSQEAHDKALEYIKDNVHKSIDITLINGWFIDTCITENISKYNMGPASFINVDCDLYISTIQILEFVIKNNICIPGTIIRYDDLMATDEYKGERRAHKEIKDKYKLKLENINEFTFKILGSEIGE